MKKYTALIVEDVLDSSNYILSRLQILCPIFKEIDQALTLEDAQTLIENKSYDIVFLDIQMPTGTSFDLLKRLSAQRKIRFEIIFITGESAKEFTLRAIKYSAIDFLYKPLDDTELVVAVNKAIEKLEHKDYNKQVQILLERMDSEHQQQTNRIAFHLHNSVVEFINMNDIIYMQADGVVSIIHLRHGRSLKTNKNLGYYKEMLLIDYNFLIVSNSILVNEEYIQRYDHHNLSITLRNGIVLKASRRCGKELKERLLQNKKDFSLKRLWRHFANKKFD